MKYNIDVKFTISNYSVTSVNAVISYQVVNSNKDLAVTLTEDSETVSSDLFQEVQFKMDGANAG